MHLRDQLNGADFSISSALALGFSFFFFLSSHYWKQSGKLGAMESVLVMVIFTFAVGFLHIYYRDWWRCSLLVRQHSYKLSFLF